MTDAFRIERVVLVKHELLPSRINRINSASPVKEPQGIVSGDEHIGRIRSADGLRITGLAVITFGSACLRVKPGKSSRRSVSVSQPQSADIIQCHGVYGIAGDTIGVFRIVPISLECFGLTVKQIEAFAGADPQLMLSILPQR